jgi:cytochrome oxidase assembly protein ShyY1
VSASVRPSKHGILLPGLFTLAVFLVLLGLGLWQVERLAWKEGLIVTLERRVNAPIEPLPQPKEWAQLLQETDEFRRVRAVVEFVDRPHAHAFTGGSALRPDVKAPGYFVFVPARLASGEIVVIDAGYTPERKYPWAGGKSEVVGYLRWPEAARWFVSAHDAAGTLWFVRDHRAMARQLGWGANVAPFYIDQESPVPAAGVPRPGPLTVKLRNDHLGYAITWFGLAAVLLVVFGFWAVSRERAARDS